MPFPVSSSIVTSVVPGQGSFPTQAINLAILASVSDGLTALQTGANPGNLLTSISNRVTTVNNGGGLVSAIPHAAAGGTTYVVGDLIYVTQTGAVAGTLVVTAVAAGVVTSLAFKYRGTGYTTATALATTTNSAAGSGLQVDIIANADSFSLSPSLAGMSIFIKNASSNTTIVKAIPHSGNAGTTYAVGDLVTVTQSGGANGTFVVAAITGGGATGPVGSLSPVTSGTGYATATALATTTNSAAGSGLQVDITVGENAFILFPATGETVDTGVANAGIVVQPGVDLTLNCFTAGAWKPSTQHPVVTNESYSTNAATSAATLAAAALVGGWTEVVVNMTGTLGAGAALTLPTVASIIAAAPLPFVAGQTYRLRVINSGGGAYAWTVTTNTGWGTLLGTMTVNQNTWRDFIVTFLSGNAMQLQSIGTGTNS
jgi:hypothetical protein